MSTAAHTPDPERLEAQVNQARQEVDRMPDTLERRFRSSAK